MIEYKISTVPENKGWDQRLYTYTISLYIYYGWMFGNIVLSPFHVLALSLFSFPNDPCAGSDSRNGTCYTEAECTSRSGSNSGSCAQVL